MARQSGTSTFNPLDESTFEIIAYNVIGRGSEVNTLPAYSLSHSSGYSGWSVGLMQWDLGQEGRRHKVSELLNAYQRWADPESRFSAPEVGSLTVRLSTPGQNGNTLTKGELGRINAFLRSDLGREFVDGLDREQVRYKWEHVGRPLAGIPWLQTLTAADPTQAAEIVAMASKRFNQGERRGLELIRHLQDRETTSTELQSWIEDVSARAPANRSALLSGRDAALRAVRLMSALELGNGPLSRRWKDEVRMDGNVSLTRGFNLNTTAQLFDAMMRNPSAGAIVVAAIDGRHVGRPVEITGSRQAQLEMAHVELDRGGVLRVRDTRGSEHRLTPHGWELDNPQRHRREADAPDHTQPGGLHRITIDATAASRASRNSDLAPLAAALTRNDDAALSRALAHLAQSPQAQELAQELAQWGRELLAAQQGDQRGSPQVTHQSATGVER